MRTANISFLSADRPSLDQFVLLSMMLHVLIIVLFGDTAGGGPRRGEKIWGALTVTVQSLLPTSGTELKLDRSANFLPSAGSQTRPTPASPGTNTKNRDGDAPVPIEVAPPVEAPAPPVLAPSFAMPPLISKEVEKSETDFVVPKPSTDRAQVPAASPAPRAEPAPREAPAIPPPPIIVPPTPEPIAPPRIERAPAVSTPLAPLPVIVPVEVPLPAAAPPPEVPAVKIEREIARPTVPVAEPKPREVAPPVVQPTAPTPAPAVAAPVPTPAQAPAKLERENVQPVAPPAEMKPREIPAAPPAPTAATVTGEPPRTEAPKPPKVEPAAAPPTALPAATKALPPSATIGTPTGENDLFKPRGNVTTPSTDAQSTGKKPGLDLDAVRRRAREINSEGGGARTLLPFPASPPVKPKSKEQQAFDKALKKNDCRDAYADMGLAAVLPLVLDAVRENGCKW